MNATPRIGLSLAVVAALAAGCGGTSGASTKTAAAPIYSLGPTKTCLVKRGAKVGRVKPLDTRLRAFRDLAQRNSIQADFKTGRVGIAFVKSEADASLLVELLTVPRDPYKLVRRSNAVLLYKPAHKRAFTAAAACLRA
jgi:hypothetical protein